MEWMSEHYDLTVSNDAWADIDEYIRDAIYTAMVNMTEKPECIEFYQQYVPPYWEDCEMTTSKSYTKNQFPK